MPMMQRPESPAAQEEGPRKDKSFRRYASNVERALSLFDTALQEWADYIAFLGRLLKALQSKPLDTAEIAHKTIVAKRLAQCLAPSLPAGVHQKTLELYAYVFSVMGKDGLSRDLSLWLPGLSPTLSFASLSIKPTLLSLFETFIVVLSPQILRSALKAIVLALLPGLEEETSEEFERTLTLLNKFRTAVSQGAVKSPTAADVAGDQNFWQSLFLASITSSSRRQGALAYLTRELPPMGNASVVISNTQTPQQTHGTKAPKRLPSEVEAVISPEPGLLVRCFIVGLQDEQLLVQRGFLDLLVSNLPLHSPVLRRSVSSNDLELLIMAAASVVARRDMSLNRRLWSWFLGPEKSVDRDESAPSSPSSPVSGSQITPSEIQDLSQTAYFERYGLEPLISGILKMLDHGMLTPSEKARPFRICLSLMDRWEIGGLVIPRIFLPAMESIWRYQKIAPSKEALAEVLRSASVFFDGIESSLIWAEITQILLEALGRKKQGSHSEEKKATLDSETLFKLVLFVVSKFNIREEEMLALHIPMATLALLISLRLGFEQAQTSSEVTFTPFMQAFKVTVQLLDVIPPRVLQSSNPLKQDLLPSHSHQMLEDIQLFYERLQKGSEDVAPPLQISVVGEAMLHNVSHIITAALSTSPIQVEFLDRGNIILEKVLRKTTSLDEYEYERLISSITDASEKLDTNLGSSSFSTVVALISLLETMRHASSSKVWESDHRVRRILPRLLTVLWEHTSPSRPKRNVEAVRCLWRIHWISPDHQLVEGSLSSLLLHDDARSPNAKMSTESARRFVTIWAHGTSTQHSLSNHRSAKGHNSVRPDSKPAADTGDSSMLERPLLLLLDSLFDKSTELFMFVTSWLQSLPSMHRIIDLVIYRLQQTTYFQVMMLDVDHSLRESSQDMEETLDDAEEGLYHLRMLLKLMKHSGPNIWTSLRSPMNMKDAHPASELSDESESVTTTQLFLTKACIKSLEFRPQNQENITHKLSSIRQTSVLLLHRMLNGEFHDTLVDLALDSHLHEALSWSIGQKDLLLQVSLMDLISAILQRQLAHLDMVPTAHRRQMSQEKFRSASQVSLGTDKNAKDYPSARLSTPSPRLLECLILGISSPNNHPILEHWIAFMKNCLPLYADSAFQSLMPLVDCFIKTIESVFYRLRALFEEPVPGMGGQSEHIAIINLLLNGLEQVLARGHDQLLQDEGRVASIKSPEQVQGFFGNMVSGVFAPEAQKSRAATANNRLTVLLCFKDAVRVSFEMWSWGDVGPGISSRETATSASFNYTSLRLRNRTRRILEHLFAAEVLECLETLVEIWHQTRSANAIGEPNTVFNLLHALDGSRPKYTIPALFNAIYSRTNPNVLEPARKSSLTSELSDSSLAMFLVGYTQSVEDDALDEIWTDCMTFLRDVLGNPLPHRLTLPTLLQFTTILGEKINNTNFGEQRKMRRDIGDLFVRLLAAMFTIKPLSFSQDLPSLTNGDDGANESSNRLSAPISSDLNDVISITALILPKISKVLVDSDRIVTATTTISTQILSPTFRWKAFPHNVTGSTLEILKTMSRIPEASKMWRKDVAEAFNDSRFFHTDSMDIIQNGWMPVLHQWALLDKDRMADLLSRLPSPASAGIMFGVGASSARQEADRKAQLNLRRIAFLILSADHDTFVVNLGSLQEKLVDLMTATAASSPSSTTRAEIYMVFRSLVQRITPVHLASLWPIISTELHGALSSLIPVHASDQYNVACELQAAKFLNTLLIFAPDDFQLREWLFITDTIDAVYRPPDWRPSALVDELAEILDAKSGTPQSAMTPITNAQQGLSSLLAWEAVHGVAKENLVDQVLRPFFRQLSIAAFESTYQMEGVDQEACSSDLLRDLFDQTTLVQ